MRQSERRYKRVVIKVGSSLLCAQGEARCSAFFGDFARQVATLVKGGSEAVLVSSGAIALGMQRLGLASRPKDLPMLQAAAACGQSVLMGNYSDAFRGYGLNCAQVLLTWDDFSDRRRYLNAKNTLRTLLKYKIVPVVNENDTVSTDEIKFGDNDRLSALVASMVSAELLVILSDVEGLLDREKRLVRVVDKITPQIKALACPTDKNACVGGMVTKIEAAKIAVDSGIPCVIAHGNRAGDLERILEEPRSFGTLFVPRRALKERERWIAFGTKPKGRITVDEGASVALRDNKSLLSVGVASVQGNFEAGDVVSIVDKEGLEVARGKVGLSSKQLEKVKGARHDREVVHRDNIVVFK